MEALEQLETCVDRLIRHLLNLREENARLQSELSSLAQTHSVLTRENISLQDRLSREEILRTEALRRVDDLLRKIQAHARRGQAL